MVGVTKKFSFIHWDKPTIVGATILDLAKLFMFDFHYKKMKQSMNCSLLYSDTDSLVYEIRTSDLYQDLLSNPELRQHFDFSNYDKEKAHQQ